KMKFLVIVFCAVTTLVNSQKVEGLCSSVDLLGIGVKNNEIKYVKYSPILKLQNKYRTFKEVKNSTVEELIISQMSVQDNDWLSFNFNKEMKWASQQFFRIKSQNTKTNYLELVRKATYTFDNENYAIVRVNVFDERREKPIVVSLKAKKEVNRWFLIRGKLKTPVEFLLTNLNLEYLDAVFEKKRTNNSTLNNIIASSWDKNNFNIASLYLKLGNLMLSDIEGLKEIFERNNSSSIEVGKQKFSLDLSLSKENIKANYLVPLNSQRFCYYFPNEISKYLEDELDLVLNYLKDKQTENVNIVPIHKFSYLRKGTNMIVFKYKVKTSKEEELKTEHYVKNNNSVIAFEGRSELDKDIYEIIRGLKSVAINEFSNGDNNPNYPEINKLKPFVKDANGVLNIEKLAKVLEENKTLLAKYLDN
ncbi:hypothetical protein V2665_08795, partial [Tenacibaculum maritimum]|uniref:hypothetical protein n=3 Tax=Tenacibaculum maritimum TaxID=107401 RepID=UPI00387699CC